MHKPSLQDQLLSAEECASSYQLRRREASKLAVLHTRLMLPGGDPISAIYWQREAKHFDTMACIHLNRAIEIGKKILATS